MSSYRRGLAVYSAFVHITKSGIFPWTLYEITGFSIFNQVNIYYV